MVVRAINGISKLKILDLDLIRGLIRLSREPSIYVSVKIELISCLGRASWRELDVDFDEEKFGKFFSKIHFLKIFVASICFFVVFDFFLDMVKSNDLRQRSAAAEVSTTLLRLLFLAPN